MKRKLVIGLVTAGLFLAGFGGAVLPASAEPHHFLLKLANGTSVPWTGEPGSAAEHDHGRRRADRRRQRPGPRRRRAAGHADLRRPRPRRAHDARAHDARAATTPAQPKHPAKQSTQPSQPVEVERAARPRSRSKKASAGADRRRQASQQPTSGHRPRPSLKRRLRLPRRRRRTTGRQAGQEGHDAKSPDDNAAPAPATHTPPAPSNPTFSLAQPGAAAVGVPNFFIDKFRIPPFLLPIYQAAGVQYGIRWEVLAAINEIETDYGRNLNVSSAGALGWMQFMPATW